MLCGILDLEDTIQVGDKTRLDASKSFVTKNEGAVTRVEIDPGDGAGFIDVTGTAAPPLSSDWCLDWIYTGLSRTITAQVRMTTNGAPVVTQQNISVVTAADDYLFSSDADLISLEPDIMKWVPDGRASWLNVHRQAQRKIMDWIRKTGLVDSDGIPYTKKDLLDIEDVRYWSRDWTLALIFKGIQNTNGDVFSEKAKFYFGEAEKGSDRAKIRLDLQHDGVLDVSDSINVTSASLVRR